MATHSGNVRNAWASNAVVCVALNANGTHRGMLYKECFIDVSECRCPSWNDAIDRFVPLLDPRRREGKGLAFGANIDGHALFQEGRRKHIYKGIPFRGYPSNPHVFRFSHLHDAYPATFPWRRTDARHLPSTSKNPMTMARGSPFLPLSLSSISSCHCLSWYHDYWSKSFWTRVPTRYKQKPRNQLRTCQEQKAQELEMETPTKPRTWMPS